MKHYLGLAAINATKPLKEVAAELSRFLTPLALHETDRFDEVPAFLASSGNLEFTLQGIPDDLTLEQRSAETAYYFELSCSSDVVDSLPSALSGLPMDALEGSNGYIDVSEFLCDRLK